jgi:hypothetical protein
MSKVLLESESFGIDESTLLPMLDPDTVKLTQGLGGFTLALAIGRGYLY